MWVMMTTKLSTKPSPPKMSIHWAIPWPDRKHSERQFDMIFEAKVNYIMRDGKKRKRRARSPHEDTSLKYSNKSKLYYGPLGNEAHWAGARKILYKDEYIRIFPHEFSILTVDNMHSYIKESHDFVPGNAAERQIEIDLTDGDSSTIRDAALLDGCNEEQALLMALGLDVSDESKFPPPIGWYKIKPEYGATFCYEEELME